jgi:small subunit ribosomal protein S16
VGSRKNPIWRVVVADQRSPRDGRVIESIGHYNPQTEPSTIVIDRDRLAHWIERGAEPSHTVRKLMRAEDTVAVATPPPAGDTPPAPAPEESPVAEADVPSTPDAPAEADGGEQGADQPEAGDEPEAGDPAAASEGDAPAG